MIAQGRSVETSMGFTPLEGLVMGKRSGDVDASIVSFLSEREKIEVAEVERWLNERSGLLGLSGRSNDMRELLRLAEEEQDKRAQSAVDLFCYRVRKYLGSVPRRVRRRRCHRLRGRDWRKRTGDSGPDLHGHGVVRPDAQPRLQSSGSGAFAGASSKNQHG